MYSVALSNASTPNTCIKSKRWRCEQRILVRRHGKLSATKAYEKTATLLNDVLRYNMSTALRRDVLMSASPSVLR